MLTDGPQLTPKQEMFCNEYLVDLNATQAAIRAGYSKKTAKDIGCENLAKPNLQERIGELMSERSKRVQLDGDYVLMGIKSVVERCVQSEFKDVDGLYKFDASAALKGYELLGRHLELFTDKHKHGGDRDNPLIHKIVREIIDDSPND